MGDCQLENLMGLGIWDFLFRETPYVKGKRIPFTVTAHSPWNQTVPQQDCLVFRNG